MPYRHRYGLGVGIDRAAEIDPLVAHRIKPAYGKIRKFDAIEFGVGVADGDSGRCFETRAVRPEFPLQLSLANTRDADFRVLGERARRDTDGEGINTDAAAFARTNQAGGCPTLPMCERQSGFTSHSGIER